MFDVIEKDLERLEEGLYKAIEAPEELVTKVGEHLVAAGGEGDPNCKQPPAPRLSQQR